MSDESARVKLAIEWAEIWLLCGCFAVAFGAGVFGSLATRAVRTWQAAITVAGWSGVMGTTSAILVVLTGYEDGSGLAQIGSSLIVGLVVGYKGAEWTAGKLGWLFDRLAPARLTDAKDTRSKDSSA